MQKLLNITLNDLRVIFRDRGIWINLVLVPAALVFIIGLANGGFVTETTPRLRVDVIDYDGSALATQFLADLRAANDTLVLCPLDNDAEDFCRLRAGASERTLDEDLARQRLINRDALALLIIPQGFEANMQAGTPASIIYRSDEEANAPSLIQQAVQAVVQRTGGALVAERVGLDVADSLEILQFSDTADRDDFGQQIFTRAQALWAENLVTVNFTLNDAIERQLSPRQQGFGQSTAGMGSMYVMFTVFGALVVLIDERKQWTLQRLVMMPVARWQLLGGKMLSRFIMGMIQYAVAFAVGAFMGVNFGRDPLAIVALMVSFTLCITALAFLLATFMRSSEQASSVSLLFILTLAPLGGAWWPLDIVPEWMRTLGHISPIAWVMDGFRALLYFNGDLSTVVTPLLVLLGAGAVFFALAVRRFRYE
ncbi:MAG: ABC transporter permease [Chloroflexi bacterium]|nr:ABC transporter permease [Chloroflexota bacterium]